MKNAFFTFLFTCAFLGIKAQQWESYLISVNGDTINCLDKKKQKQGKWVIRVEELRGEPGYEEEGEFVDSKKEGIWRRYNLSGDLIAMENYRWGFRDGKQSYYTMLGDLMREESYKSVNPENPYDTIDVPDLDNPGQMMTRIVKHDGTEIRHGTWKTYDPSTGMVVKTEQFVFGEKYTGNKSASTNGNAAVDEDKPKAKPKEVEAWEKKNSGKKKVTVRDGRTGPG
ncbi:hypothetical protein [Pollutibacter soli]|uniref:hypothetical protein n=1 Tax=Pollutibacter soli TaxID=3034157 RepID=UPI003013BA3C